MKRIITKILSQVPGNGRTVLRKRRPGLTLVELAVVVMVIGVLITVLYSSLGDNKEKISTRMLGIKMKKQVAIVFQALDDYKMEYGTYPTETMGLEVLVEQGSEAPDNWKPVLSKKDNILDPWKRVFRYKLNEDGRPVILTYGADNKPGGTGENADQEFPYGSF